MVYVAFVLMKHENGGIGIFTASFWNLTNETYLLFSSALTLFLQIIVSDNIASLVPGLKGKKLPDPKKASKCHEKAFGLSFVRNIFSEIRNTDPPRRFQVT